jgi:urea transporter
MKSRQKKEVEMETNLSPDLSTRAGTIGGTLMVVLLQITSEEIIKTAVLAGIGAIVSFSISLVLKYLVRRIKKMTVDR